MRDYFKSLRFWWVDLIACYIVACMVTPADPLSVYIAFIPLFSFWMAVRYLITRRYRAGS